MRREVEQAGGTYTLRELSEAYWCEFAWENEELTCSKGPTGESL
jgi:hypothetical protein